ncbi:MAG: asparagine synthase (glutamine-hydrolyzing), partial [Hyphomicrobiales bacterium]|nr:asparagine synthase (glutamine-hydrolyzing) [Hyphomicrobiales bacterium]
MCGLNGIFAYHHAASLPSREELIATRDHMRSRGPDGEGLWCDSSRRCGLAHRRLSIIDLSDAGLQPMVSGDGDLVIVFNGEIYNYRTLRAELERGGAQFRTRTDTEVLLHLYARDGVAMTSALRGMYAFAIWDERRGGLFLARDPLGIKPLYTSNDGWTFRFASQVKALLAGGNVSRDPEPAGVVGFHLFGSVPEPFTVYREIRAFPPGHHQWVDATGPREPRAFANVADELAQGTSRSLPEEGLQESVRSAALDTVRAHLEADVEVGVFLSGGVDSGALLGLMRDAGRRHARAITVSFEGFVGTINDETGLAARVARQYGAEHHIRLVRTTELNDDLPAILEAMDQPSIDGINAWFIAKAARECGLKVALSGVGGDELVAGYPSFVDIPRSVRWMQLPGAIPGLGVGIRRLSAAVMPVLARRFPKALGVVEYGGSYTGAYLLRRGLYLPFELTKTLDDETVRDGMKRLEPLSLLATGLKPDPGSPAGRVAALEVVNYMRNQLLRDADWAGMAHSVEVRTPLADLQFLRRLAGYAPRMSAGVGKRALAAAPSEPLPPDLVERPKTGFGVPANAWLADRIGSRKGDASMGATSRLWARRVADSYAS